MEVYFNRTSVHRNSLYGIGAAYMILFFCCKINGAFCFYRLRIFRPHGREKRLKNRACFPFAPGKRVSCQVQTPGLPGAKGLFARCKRMVCQVQTGDFPGWGAFLPIAVAGREWACVLIFRLCQPGVLCLGGRRVPAKRCLSSQRIHSRVSSSHTALSVGRGGASSGMVRPK